MSDDLMARYIELGNRVEFDPDTFWQEWQRLAEDFDKAGRPQRANGCYGRADWYKNVRTGYAQKLMYREITSVPADYIVAPDELVLACIQCGTWTKHVRNSQGWACGCGEQVPVYEGAL